MSVSPSRAPSRSCPPVSRGRASAAGDRRRRSGLAAAVLVSLALTACTETGDLGRPRPSLLNEIALTSTGTLAARLRGEPVSRHPLTDDEIELRDRAWRFIAPAHERAWLDRAIAELARTRVLPIGERLVDHRAYHDLLLAGGFRSVASRYQRLAEDATVDARLIAPFVTVAVRVIGADRVRLRSLSFVGDLSAAQVGEAVARVAENRCVIAWVRHESLTRREAYRYALEHLVLAAPQGEAIPAERALAGLDAQRRAFEALPVPPLHAQPCGETSGPVHRVVDDVDQRATSAGHELIVKD